MVLREAETAGMYIVSLSAFFSRVVDKSNCGFECCICWRHFVSPVSRASWRGLLSIGRRPYVVSECVRAHHYESKKFRTFDSVGRGSIPGSAWIPMTTRIFPSRTLAGSSSRESAVTPSDPVASKSCFPLPKNEAT